MSKVQNTQNGSKEDQDESEEQPSENGNSQQMSQEKFNNEGEQIRKSQVEKIHLQCPIHHQDIVKVCPKKNCREKMFFCLECIEEFADHVVKHRPFIPINQFISELSDNPHTQRKERIEMLQQQNGQSVTSFLMSLANEKDRIQKKLIPAMKEGLSSLCDQLQARIFDEMDQFSYIYQYNSKYLSSYLEQKGLLAQIIDQVPSFGNIYQKYQEMQGIKEGELHEYLERVHRRVLNNSFVEQTKQAFGYFEELFDKFRQQANAAPKFVGESDLLAKVGKAFDDFLENGVEKYSDKVFKYPICSSCSQVVSGDAVTLLIQKKISELEKELKQKQENAVTIPAAVKSKAKVDPKMEDPKQNQSSIQIIQKEIERLQKSKPGSCRGCRRMYCALCQDQVICKGCKIEPDPSLKSSKFIVKENKGMPVAMLDDTSKQGVVTLNTNYALNAKLACLSSILKKLNVGLALCNQEFYTGKYDWDVVVENFGQCHSMAFGLVKLDDLKEELDLNKDFKDFIDKKSLILLSTNGTVSGGLKGRVSSFQKEKNAMTFTCLLDFGKNKFSITGKNIYIEVELENNQGYTPCFYSGCCFKSYNNFSIKQKFSFLPLSP